MNEKQNQADKFFYLPLHVAEDRTKSYSLKEQILLKLSILHASHMMGMDLALPEIAPGKHDSSFLIRDFCLSDEGGWCDSGLYNCCLENLQEYGSYHFNESLKSIGSRYIPPDMDDLYDEEAFDVDYDIEPGFWEMLYSVSDSFYCDEKANPIPIEEEKDIGRLCYELFVKKSIDQFPKTAAGEKARDYLIAFLDMCGANLAGKYDDVKTENSAMLSTAFYSTVAMQELITDAYEENSNFQLNIFFHPRGGIVLDKLSKIKKGGTPKNKRLYELNQIAKKSIEAINTCIKLSETKIIMFDQDDSYTIIVGKTDEDNAVQNVLALAVFLLKTVISEGDKLLRLRKKAA